MLELKIKRLSETATLPTYGSDYAAALDLYADIGFTNHHYVDLDVNEPSALSIQPHQTVKIGCGFAFQPPKGYAGFIYARSGLSTKQGLRPSNCVGVCDNDFIGEYIIPLHNDSDEPQTIHHGDRIAQLLFLPIERVELIEVNNLDSTNRGTNGFGSTGV